MSRYKIFIGVFGLLVASAEMEGQTCKMCEEIREYNRTHPENNYEYYDDYLKDLACIQKKEAKNQESKEKKPDEK